MNMISSTVLNSHVANETAKAVRNSMTHTNDNDNIENTSTLEDELENESVEMWALFFFGICLGIGYWFLMANGETDGFVDFIYMVFYFLCGMAVISVSLDDKQPVSAIKTSYILSAVLAVVMLTPFIMDMDTQIHFREVWGGFGVNGNMHYFYNEYTDYTNYIQIGFMVLLYLIDVVLPLRRLYKMKNEI